MRDLRSILIMRDDDVAFIKNNKGDDPRLVFGIVVAVGDNSIDVEDEDGVLHNVRFTQRSMLADKMLNVVTIPARPDVMAASSIAPGIRFCTEIWSRSWRRRRRALAQAFSWARPSRSGLTA